MFTVDVDTQEAERKLQDVIKTMTGKTGEMKPLYRAMGVFMCTDYFDAAFRTQGAVFGKQWQVIHPLTSVLRIKKGKKSKTMEDIKAHRKNQKPLQDTGKLRQSFMPGRANSGFKVANTFVIAGSVDPRAGQLHEGYDVPPGTFWTDDRRARLRKNIWMRLPGAPEKRPAGKRTHANPLAGHLIAIGRSIAKKGARVPARPLREKVISPRWVTQLATVAEREVLLLVYKKKWN
ncbi:MAG: hypothetical protein U9Q07_00440 [Planctomycetota bacterium]|nr:hypothetical protein [Planctomycetota bacterium]